MNRLYHFLVFTLLFHGMVPLLAQKPDWMKPHPEGKSLFVQGILKDRDDSTVVLVGQIIVTNIGNANESYTFKPNGTGIFQFHLWENSTYVVDFSAEGYVNRKIEFDTHQVPIKEWKKGCNVEITMDLDLRPDGFKDLVTVKPFVTFKYSESEKLFNFDQVEMEMEMEKYFGELERARGKSEVRAEENPND